MLKRIKEELKQGKTLLQFGFISATGQALGMVGPLVVAKFFSPELFGRYSLAKMVVFFFTSFLISSAQTPFIVFANQEKAKSGKINRTFSVQCVFFILSLCIFAAITLLLGKYIMLFVKIDRVDLFFVLLAFVGVSLKIFLCNLFMAMGERIKNSLAELVFGFLTLALVFVFYFVDLINLRTILLIYLLSTGVLIIVFIWTIDFKLLLPLKFNKEHFKGMLNFTKWLMMGAVAAYLIDWGHNFVLRYFVSMEDIGIYNLGYSVFKGVVALTLIIYSYFLPFVSEHIDNSEKMRGYFYEKRPRIFIFGFSGIVLLFVFVPYVFKVIYGNVYDKAISISRILLIAEVIILYTVFYEAIFYALKSYKLIQLINIIHVTLNLLLAVMMVPFIGMKGAAIATLLAYLCRGVIMEVYFRVKMRKTLNL